MDQIKKEKKMIVIIWDFFFQNRAKKEHKKLGPG
jgi:hypothetical protein